MKNNYRKIKKRINGKIFVFYKKRSSKWKYKKRSIFVLFIFANIPYRKIYKFLIKDFLESYKTYNIFADKRQIFLKKF